MRSFNSHRSGGGKSGKFGRKGGSRGGPEMHRAVCADCGKQCEVPFKPTPGKSVLCSNCFRKDDSGSGRSNRRDFGRSGSGDRRMHKATCADCGKLCEVPFKPTGEKPVYCSNCFASDGGATNSSSVNLDDKMELLEDQFRRLNKKLDKIVAILEVIKPKQVFTVTQSEAEAASEEVEMEDLKSEKKSESVKKTPVKKKVAKKAPAKKKATAKKKAK